MNRMIRSLLSLLLVLLMLVPLCATAFAAKATCAEDLRLKPYSFPTDQYYECGPNDTWVYTVQIAAGGSYQGAIDRANGLVAKGLDGFVYKENGMYYVMSGKFSTDYEALCYGELIHTDPKEYSAFQTSVAIPKKAIDTFQGILYAHVGVNWDKEKGGIAGDVDFDAVEPVVKSITPVPGGVGSVTTSVLASHVVEAAKKAAGK